MAPTSDSGPSYNGRLLPRLSPDLLALAKSLGRSGAGRLSSGEAAPRPDQIHAARSRLPHLLLRQLRQQGVVGAAEHFPGRTKGRPCAAKNLAHLLASA